MESYRPFDNIKVSGRLRDLREEKKWSQSEMGEKLNEILGERMNLAGDNGKQTVSQLERGRKITIDIAFAYASIFDKSVDFILGRTDDWQQEYKEIKELTGLSDESIETLINCYSDWAENSITKTINELLKNRYVLYCIAEFLFYDLENPSCITLRYKKSKPLIAQWGNAKPNGYYVDTIKPIPIGSNQIKKILLFEIQSELDKLLEELSIEGCESNGQH